MTEVRNASAPLNSHLRTVIGIDPGLHITGYGILQLEASTPKLLDYGIIRMPTTLEIPAKLCAIQEALRSLMLLHKVEAMAIETQFVHRNVASALKLGMVRGVALALAQQLGLTIHEYAPTLIKKATTGRGMASKEQMQSMVAMRLSLKEKPSADAADALAMALCHLNRNENFNPLFSRDL